LPPTVAEFGDIEEIVTLPPLAHDNSGDYLQAIKNSQFDNKAHFHENLTNNRPSSQPPVFVALFDWWGLWIYPKTMCVCLLQDFQVLRHILHIHQTVVVVVVIIGTVIVVGRSIVAVVLGLVLPMLIVMGCGVGLGIIFHQ
jgi:hypothetical protein